MTYEESSLIRPAPNCSHMHDKKVGFLIVMFVFEILTCPSRPST